MPKTHPRFGVAVEVAAGTVLADVGEHIVLDGSGLGMFGREVLSGRERGAAR